METKPNIVIIGAGQVGMSIALGIAGKFSDRITLFDTDAAHAAEANRVAYDQKVENYINAFWIASSENIYQRHLGQADIVILATPISQFGPVTKAIAGFLKPGALLTDVGSVKKPAVDAIKAELRKSGRTDVDYIWVHPGTGNALSGPKAARAAMYQGQRVFIESLLFTVGQNTPTSANYQRLQELWKSLGAIPTKMKAINHDLFFGVTSHFQHVLAFSLMAVGSEDGGFLCDEYKKAGTFLRNFVRIATSGKTMWQPIFEGNKDVIVDAATGFNKHIEAIRECIDKANATELKSLLKKAYDFRASLAPKDANNNPPVMRENIFGEIDDILGTKNPDILPSDAVALLNAQGKGKAFARVTLTPFLIAVAASLNAAEKLVSGFNLSDNVGPSFLDGTAPALNDPAYMAHLLIASKDLTLPPVERFLRRFHNVVNHIKTGRAHAPFIGNMIDTVNNRMEEMSLPRRWAVDVTGQNDAVRDEYVIKTAAPDIEPPPHRPAQVRPIGRGRGVTRCPNPEDTL